MIGTLDNVSPASLGTPPASPPWQVQIGYALEAQQQWASRPLKHRLALLTKFRHLLTERHIDVLSALSHLPRTPAQSLVTELLPLAEACQFLERCAPRILAPRTLGPGPFWLGNTRSTIARHPLGLVLILAPSNYPLFLPGVQLLQALAAGNAVLLKPAPTGAPAARLLASTLADAGLPAHLLTLLPEETPFTETLLDAAPLAKVFLTGSFTTAQKVLHRLAPRAVPTVLELSGNDPAILLPESDPQRFLACLRFGLLLNHGQTCIAPRRAFVPRLLLPAIAHSLANLLFDAPAYPLPSPIHQRLLSHIADARAKGATLLTPLPTTADAVTPQLLSNVTSDMQITHEDLFAPHLSLMPYDSEADLLDQLASSPYALAASVFGNEQAAHAFAAKLPAGTITLNDLIAPTADPRLPFTPAPASRSGHGTTRGPEGLLEMTYPRATITRKGAFLPHLQRPSSNDTTLFTHLLRARHSPSLKSRLSNLFHFLKTAIQSAKSNSF